jgi:CBS domain-containing protein
MCTGSCTVLVDIFAGVALFAAGIGVVWTAKKLELELGEASKTAIVLLPLLLYLVLSNRLTEFEGYGLKAKFRSLGTESAIGAARTSDLALVSDQADPKDFFNEAQWGFCRPYYLLTDGLAKSKDNPNDLDRRVTLSIATAVRHAIICGRFKALIVVDASRKPIGFFVKDHFLEILRIALVSYGGTLDSDVALQSVTTSELGVILRDPAIRAKSEDARQDTVSSTETIESVYKKMIANNIEIALITDRLGRFDGIITREAIESRIIQGLLTAAK